MSTIFNVNANEKSISDWDRTIMESWDVASSLHLCMHECVCRVTCDYEHLFQIYLYLSICINVFCFILCNREDRLRLCQRGSSAFRRRWWLTLSLTSVAQTRHQNSTNYSNPLSSPSLYKPSLTQSASEGLRPNNINSFPLIFHGINITRFHCHLWFPKYNVRLFAAAFG